MKKFIGSFGVLVTLLSIATGPVSAQPTPATVVADDLLQLPSSAGSAPLARLNVLRELPDGTHRLFVNDMQGPLHVIDGGSVSTYLDLSVEFPNLKTSPGLGSGFVSFAFDPEFGASGLFYTAHTEFVGAVPPNLEPAIPTTIIQHAVLTEWTATDPTANSFSGTRRELMRIASPHRFHNIQEIAFNPYAGPGDEDYRLLYIGNGDYGSVITGQPDQLQRLDTVWGAVLRIDPLGGPFTRGTTTYGYGIPSDNPFVDGDPNTFDEIYVYGVRNTHRLAWDPATGMLFGMDIGEDNFEEINLLEPGRNFGWPFREGNRALNPLSPGSVFPLPPNDSSLGYSYPVGLYSHGFGLAIAGGFPYRGAGILDLQGKFIFGDIVTGQMFHADISELIAMDDDDPETVAAFTSTGFVHDEQPASLLQVIAAALGVGGVSRADLRFAIDGGGELLITTKQDGYLRRLVASVGSGPGRTPNNMTMDRGSVGQIELSWHSGSCSGAEDHAIYEGTIGDWQSHQSVVCTDGGGDRTETISPAAGNRYYLVVPIDSVSEGSYGVDSQKAERFRPAAGTCRASQELSCL